jgi:hypothetical protein
MSFRSQSSRAAAAIVILAVCPCAAASAQTPRERPGALALFGGSDPQLQTRAKWFDATVSVAGAFDDDLTGDQGVTSTSGDSRVSGQYSVLDAYLSVARKHRRLSIVALGSSSVQRYQNLDRFVGSNGSGSAVITANLGRKTLFRTSVDASRLSTFSIDALTRPAALEQVIEAGTAEGLPKSGFPSTRVDWTMTTVGGTGELVKQVGRRTAVGFIAGGRRYERGTLDLDGDEQNAGLQMWRATGRASSLRLAYTYQHMTQQATRESRRTETHDIVLGFEKRWVHSATRRTTLAVSGGPASQRLFLRAESTPAIEEPHRLFRIVGGAALNHMITDTWSARLFFRRGTGVADGLVFSNTAAVDIRGSWTRRLDLLGSVGYTDGDLGVGALRNRYATSYASARVQFALARSVAIYGQSFFYRYDFGRRAAPIPSPSADPELPPSVEAGLPGQSAPLLDRRGVRVGISVWVPFR